MADPPRLDSPRSLFGLPRAVIDRALPDREDVLCPVCRVAPQPFAVDFQGLHLARCRTCGLEFHSPRPVFSQLTAAVYGAAYHRSDEAVVDRARAALFARQLDRLERLLPPSRRRLLDVGCGAGAFLQFARARGWTVEGSDVVVTEWARAGGVRVWEGQLQQIAFGDVLFDVVRFNHVLEHTVDPVAELERARQLVATGGILLAGVPNLAGLSTRLKSWQSRLCLKDKRWRHYAALHHFWFFTPVTLRRVIERAGYEPVCWDTPMGDRPGRARVLRAVYRWALERSRAGSLMDFYARVP